MTDAKSKEPIDDEIFRRLPKAYQILVEFARERGIIGNERPSDRSEQRNQGGEEGSDAG